MREVNLYYPGKVAVGNGCIKQLAGDVSASGVKKLFIVSIPSIVGQLNGLWGKLKAAGVETQFASDLKSEPTFSDFYKYLEQAKLFGADCVAGIGGGSVMDLAKIVAGLLNAPQVLEEVVGIGLLKGRATKLICVPTTSGTGSEMSPNSILLDDRDQVKKGIISPFLVPDLVYIDPELTIDLPSEVTSYTGFDALTHCIEAYCNKNAHPVVDGYALEGIRLIGKSIVQAVNNGKDIEARTNMALGSMYGGMCLGPVNTAAVHAMAYPLGTDYHMAHGLSNAVLLPYVMKFNLDADYKRYADVAVALGAAKGKDDKGTAESGIEYLFQLLKQCKAPVSLREVGVKPADFEKMAQGAVNVKRLMVNNLKDITVEDAVEIYKSAF